MTLEGGVANTLDELFGTCRWCDCELVWDPTFGRWRGVGTHSLHCAHGGPHAINNGAPVASARVRECNG